jgi:hypothetical protein
MRSRSLSKVEDVGSFHRTGCSVVELREGAVIARSCVDDDGDDEGLRLGRSTFDGSIVVIRIDGCTDGSIE